ncbi:heterodisulfide reductase-related iron-sulfur binding cluster [Oleiagrimonas sp.]|jgi:glycerol-3-phosphate dehydrogenase subunit C|uniref:heterodisulfide reductase-related iron-sulfur binding cluster n=1 Tax=Oleiagrimonas sp. TaxID=2010330 RepID=UPI00260EE517|nr:heterodisulfide reductase-related iron-sulfur binding cluster [Oleiagrimonas sp.]MDA3914080.1 heterodisulfide reductase-related iron-sulfur binding cluster [Oleiagrimonas sp.]
MAEDIHSNREGNLEAPTRHPLDWMNEEFWDQDALDAELERVFDICHGCRRCVSLCHAFPTLFDLIDESETLEIDGVDKADYGKVTEHCYLCDLCYQTKCPYTPPHPWNVDFPHLMLRAKAVKFRKEGAPMKARVLSSTSTVGKLASIPVVVEVVNAANRNATARKLLEKTLGVHRDAGVPAYQHPSARKRLAGRDGAGEALPAGRTSGKVAVFATCYCDHSMPEVVEDLVAVLEHNKVPVRMVESEQCCGMPKFELGDLDTVKKYKEQNIPVLAKMAREGWDFIAAIPSCVLMFKQELPLMFPDDADVALVRDHFYDPFEYLSERNKDDRLATDFNAPLGKVTWQVACHQRVQKIGPKTREILELVPDTEITTIERCSGHDGTYGVKLETYAISRKIAKPVERRVTQSEPDHFTSDCPMAGNHIAHGLDEKPTNEHPLSLLRKAYGI